METETLESGEVRYIYDLHKMMLNQQLIMVYEGEINQDVTIGLLAMTERKINSNGEALQIQRRIFNIMVECLQNISFHAAKPVNADFNIAAIFAIGRDEKNYYIYAGNVIENTMSAPLRDKIEHINAHDRNGLKELYKKVIMEDHGYEHGKTGLGLIDIALKSGEKLIYDFVIINEQFAFYTFQTKLNII